MSWFKIQDDHITLENLNYYFDGVQRDALDLGKASRKSSQVLALRQKLLALPEQEFDAAIKTMEKLVENVRPDGSPENQSKIRKREAIELFERTAEVSGKKLQPDKVSRV